MNRLVRRLLLVLAAVPSLVVLAPAPPALAAGTTTFVTMVGESGAYVGGNAARLWRPATGTVSVTGSPTTAATVSVSGPAGSYDFTFAAPVGEALTVGRYENAQRTSFRDDGLPGIDIDGEGAGCNTVEGSFEILEISPDLSSLWLVYEHHCEGHEPAVFGEIKFRVANVDSSVRVAPSRIAWPDEYPSVSGRPVPVTLINAGSSPVDVTDVEITSGAADFTVLNDTCGRLAVDATCSIYVGFAPSRAGERSGTLRISDTSSTGSHTVALSGSGIPGRTAWKMQSEPGDFIGGGHTYSWDPTNATITASGTDAMVDFRVTSGGLWFDATFEADSGHLLLPGTTFSGATRYPFNSTSTPGMDVSGDGRGCNELTGSFTVHEAAYVDGILDRIRITFEQHCEGDDAALRGTLWWRSEDVVAPPVATDLTIGASARTVTFGDRVGIGGVLMGTTAEGPVAEQPVTLYRRADGTRDWRVVRSVETGANGSWSTMVAPRRNTEYKAAFPGSEDHLGAAAGPVLVNVAPRVTLSATTTEAQVGDALILVGDVSPPTAGEVVRLQRSFGGAWHIVATKALDSDGRVRFKVVAGAQGTLRFRLVKPATSTHVRGHSAAVDVIVN